MTDTQIKLDIQIRNFSVFCCHIEDRHPGLSGWFMQQDKYQLCRTLENQIESLFQKDEYIAAIQLIVKLRNCWMEAVNEFKIIKEI